MEDTLWTESLPNIAALHVLSYLDVSDVLPVVQVCKHWNSWLNWPNVWLEFCRKLDLDLPHGTEDYREAVRAWATHFAGYRQYYSRMHHLYKRLVAALTLVCPYHLNCLKAPPTRPTFDIWCRLWSKAFMCESTPHDVLPPELCCWYLITDVIDEWDRPLFGMLECYDMFLGAHPVPARLISTSRHSAVHESVPIAGPFLRISLEDSGMGKRGNIWMYAEENDSFVVAESWDLYLENFILLLERGIYVHSPQYGISKWPAKGIPEETTRDIRVTASSVHHPASLEETCLFMYYITLSMDASACRNKSKLQKRHWRIVDLEGQVNEVDGAGVIGAFPIIGPGDSFSYSSCCPLPTPGGTMEGHFIMQDLVTGELWQLPVPQMVFKVQKTITALTIAAGDLQTS